MGVCKLVICILACAILPNSCLPGFLSCAYILANPPESDRSGGAVGVGTAFAVGARERKTVESKERGKKSRNEMRLDFYGLSDVVLRN